MDPSSSSSPPLSPPKTTSPILSASDAEQFPHWRETLSRITGLPLFGSASSSSDPEAVRLAQEEQEWNKCEALKIRTMKEGSSGLALPQLFAAKVKGLLADSRNQLRPIFSLPPYKPGLADVPNPLDPAVDFMLKHLRLSGCPTTAASIHCAPCDATKSGGFSPEHGVLLCQNWLKNSTQMSVSIRGITYSSTGSRWARSARDFGLSRRRRRVLRAAFRSGSSRSVSLSPSSSRTRL